jgi:colanic acid/amylovoran biosynthesis glycosyltransferase
LKKPNLIIFTEGHPDVDTGFITPELNIIYNEFERILVFPVRWEHKSSPFRFPDNISFHSELADLIKSISSVQKKILGLFSLLFWSSFLKINPSKYKSLLNTCGYISIIRKWITKIDFSKENTIFYTYWLTAPTLALSSLRRQNKICYLVSRAHGFDLYNERGDDILNFFKPFIFKNLDILFCVSENGKQYLLKRYNEYADKFAVSRLGTFNQFNSSTHISNSIEIVSCSFLSPVKRIDLLILGIEALQSKFPTIQIKWVHIGGGTLFNELNSMASDRLEPGSFHFTGTLSSNELYNLYKNNSYRCFINVSESEGLPVSIMEAQSFGIPVVATAVGGTPEIVNNDNGFLLPENPSPDEIAMAIYDVIINEEKWESKRSLSRKNWEENFNADKNYKSFADKLLSILNSG